ncbi:MAG: antibiotic biosynthesis monooxygenase [Pyrinomonadaceae bacterium]|nr:antibiotic biosynthesis monooxygenase [Pyrinomonadaceae bacterium]
MSEEKIVLFARLKVKKGTEDELKRAALAIVADSRSEDGCLNYDFHQSLEDSTVFTWHETWANKSALDAHFKMPYFAELGAQVKDITDEPLQLTLTKMVSEKA